MIVLLGWAVLKTVIPGFEATPFTIDVVSAGADVTRHGGRTVAVSNEHGAVTQTCNGACDDLRLQEDGGDNSYAVRVLDREGASLASANARYVTSGYGAWVYRFDIGGRDALRIRTRELASDGSEIIAAPEHRRGAP